MSKYTRKKKVRDADEFIDFWQRMYQLLEPYARAIGVTGLTALVITMVVSGVSSYFEHKAENATELFGRAEKIYDADLTTDDTPPKTDEENPIPHFKTHKDRAQASLAELGNLEKTFPRSNVTKSAQLFHAGLLFDLERFDDAIAAFGKVVDKESDPPIVAIAREGRGLAYEAKGQLDDALIAYRSLEPKVGNFYRDRSLCGQARIYARKGDKKKAAELYQEALNKVPSTILRDDIQNRLAMLEGD